MMTKFSTRRVGSFAFLAFVMAVLAVSCKGDEGEEEKAKEYNDFVEFYERFHLDSAFQMQHILFPLQGLPSVGDTTAIAGKPYFWQEDSWVMHHPFNENNQEFTRTIKPFGPDLMEEQIVHQNGQIGMLRRWSRLDGKWYLVYYAAINPISQ